MTINIHLDIIVAYQKSRITKIIKSKYISERILLSIIKIITRFSVSFVS